MGKLGGCYETHEMVKKIKEMKIKPFNNGTMSEAAFFGWLRNGMRRMSMYWKPIGEVRKDARVKYVGPNKRRKWSYVCAICGIAKDVTQTSVHHIEECGSLKSFEELSIFAKKLFVEKQGLILLCDLCHKKLHKN